MFKKNEHFRRCSIIILIQEIQKFPPSKKTVWCPPYIYACVILFPRHSCMRTNCWCAWGVCSIIIVTAIIIVKTAITDIAWWCRYILGFATVNCSLYSPGKLLYFITKNTKWVIEVFTNCAIFQRAVYSLVFCELGVCVHNKSLSFKHFHVDVKSISFCVLETVTVYITPENHVE